MWYSNPSLCPYFAFFHAFSLSFFFFFALVLRSGLSKCQWWVIHISWLKDCLRSFSFTSNCASIAGLFFPKTTRLNSKKSGSLWGARSLHNSRKYGRSLFLNLYLKIHFFYITSDINRVPAVSTSLYTFSVSDFSISHNLLRLPSMLQQESACLLACFTLVLLWTRFGHETSILKFRCKSSVGQ